MNEFTKYYVIDDDDDEYLYHNGLKMKKKILNNFNFDNIPLKNRSAAQWKIYSDLLGLNDNLKEEEEEDNWKLIDEFYDKVQDLLSKLNEKMSKEEEETEAKPLSYIYDTLNYYFGHKTISNKDFFQDLLPHLDKIKNIKSHNRFVMNHIKKIIKIHTDLVNELE